MTPQEREKRIREARDAAERYKAEWQEAAETGDVDAFGHGLIGWAYASTVAGLSALSRPGITLTDEQKAYVQHCIEAGKTADAQRLILDTLSEQDDAKE